MLFDKNKHKAMMSQRKRIEQMLRHLGMISEKTEDGIVVVDLKGTIHFANTPWARMHGYATSKQLLGKHIHAFHNMTQMQNSVSPSLQEAQRTGKFTGRIEHVRRDGNVFITHTRMVVLKDEKDEPAGVMVFARDMTDGDRLQEKLDVASDRAEKLQQQVEQLQAELAEHKQTEEELQKYCDRLEQRVEHMTGEPGGGGEEPVQETAAPKPASAAKTPKQAAAPEAKAAKTPHVSDEEAHEDEELKDMVVPLNPEKLKDIADLAKRLR